MKKVFLVSWKTIGPGGYQSEKQFMHIEADSRGDAEDHAERYLSSLDCGRFKIHVHDYILKGEFGVENLS